MTRRDVFVYFHRPHHKPSSPDSRMQEKPFLCLSPPVRRIRGCTPMAATVTQEAGGGNSHREPGLVPAPPQAPAARIRVATLERGFLGPVPSPRLSSLRRPPEVPRPAHDGAGAASPRCALLHASMPRAARSEGQHGLHRAIEAQRTQMDSKERERTNTGQVNTTKRKPGETQQFMRNVAGGREGAGSGRQFREQAQCGRAAKWDKPLHDGSADTGRALGSRRPWCDLGKSVWGIPH